MVVKKNGKKAPTGESSTSDLAAMRGTLEDYFNSKKAYQPDHMRGLNNSEVTKHLLTGTGDDNAMVMDKQHDEDDAATARSTGADVGGERSDDAKETASEQDAAKATGEGGEGSDYEDDYESDSSATAAEKSVAGMTLGDYLHAKGDGLFPLETEASQEPAAPKPEKLPQKPSASHKKPLPPAVISGMSLDYYLGASSAAAKDTEGDDDEYSYHHADSKSPPKRKKLGKTKAKSLLATLPARQPPPPDYASHDEFATPYQKRMKKQTKLKQQQQQHSGSVAKSILLGDSPSNAQLLTTTHLPAPSSSSSQPKDKKKHGSAGSQPPLPKLLGTSASSHAFLPTAHCHSDDDDNAGDEPSGFVDDDSADEKLPPLPSQHASHK